MGFHPRHGTQSPTLHKPTPFNATPAPKSGTKVFRVELAKATRVGKRTARQFNYQTALRSKKFTKTQVKTLKRTTYIGGAHTLVRGPMTTKARSMAAATGISSGAAAWAKRRRDRHGRFA